MKPDIELACVRRLLLALSRPEGSYALESCEPPAADVRVRWPDGSCEAIEVTEIHPDESLGQGSAARATEERAVRRDPTAIAASWIKTDAMPALQHRVSEKVRKSSGYVLQPGESLSLLIVAAMAQPGAAASTQMAWPFLSETLLNQWLHAALSASQFCRAYLHLQLWHGLWEWTRPAGWHVMQTLRAAADGSEVLAMLRQHVGCALLPGTEILGRWP